MLPSQNQLTTTPRRKIFGDWQSRRRRAARRMSGPTRWMRYARRDAGSAGGENWRDFAEANPWEALCGTKRMLFVAKFNPKPFRLNLVPVPIASQGQISGPH